MHNSILLNKFNTRKVMPFCYLPDLIPDMIFILHNDLLNEIKTVTWISNDVNKISDELSPEVAPGQDEGEGCHGPQYRHQIYTYNVQNMFCHGILHFLQFSIKVADHKSICSGVVFLKSITKTSLWKKQFLLHIFSSTYYCNAWKIR